jgi:hypothetical protein
MFLNVYEDGQIKILATSLTEGVYLFEENTSYTEDKLFAIPSACGEWMKDVAYHDLDNDGTDEIVYSLNNAYGTHGVNYATSNGSGSYVHHAISGIQSPKYDNLLFIDMDGDGDDDIVTTEENDNSNTEKGMGFFWYENKLDESNDVSECETNVAYKKNIVDFSAQFDTNWAAKINDSINDTKWAIDGYNNWLIIDLGHTYELNKIELVPNKDRDYQFKLELSDDLINWTMATDQTANTTGGALITKTFAPKSGRYARFTVTGATTYTGTWITILELRLFNTCTTTDTYNQDEIQKDPKVFPNPTKGLVNVHGAKDKKIRLYDEHGVLNFSFIIPEEEYVLDINGLSSGRYFINLNEQSFVIIKI